MTDPSPRLRATLRYMIYGRDGNFDAENLIDLLQALEKFTAVRDDGDGSAFKVNGVRGMKVVGSAGDFVGSQQVDLSERDTDVDGGRFRVSGTNASPVTGMQSGSLAAVSSESVRSTVNDQETVRGALSFFFGNEGNVLREFMLEEIVTVVDASGRNALQELGRTLGFNRLPIPVPSFIRAINPELSENDKRVSNSIRTSSFRLKQLTQNYFLPLSLLRWYNR